VGERPGSGIASGERGSQARLLIVKEHHLRRVLTEYLQHYDTARPHRALGQLAPAQADTGPPEINLAEHRIRRHAQAIATTIYVVYEGRGHIGSIRRLSATFKALAVPKDVCS
jgi:hypothetical protein